MAELKKRWEYEDQGRLSRGEWWLCTTKGLPDRNRAFISKAEPDGTRILFIWNAGAISETPWVEHMRSKDLKTLKAIGRIEAARRLNV